LRYTETWETRSAVAASHLLEITVSLGPPPLRAGGNRDSTISPSCLEFAHRGRLHLGCRRRLEFAWIRRPSPL